MLFNRILPTEAVLDTPRIILTGTSSLIVEGHRGLLSYSRESIRLRLSSGSLACLGKELVITRFSADDMCIEGCISALEITP